MHEIDLTFTRLLSVFWLMVWRSLVGGLVLGVAVGFVVGVAGFLMGVNRESVVSASRIAGFLVGFSWWPCSPLDGPEKALPTVSIRYCGQVIFEKSGFGSRPPFAAAALQRTSIDLHVPRRGHHQAV